MAAPMSCFPGGAEFDEDYDDDDGFFLDGFSSSNQNTTSIFSQGKHQGGNEAHGDSGLQQETKPERSQGHGGFGVPPSRKKTADRTHYKPVISKGVTLTDSDFHMAIIRGHQEIVEQFLKEGRNVDTVLNSGWTGAMYSANIANVSILKLLLEHGADCNYNKEQYTVLMAACGASGKPESDVLACVELLMSRGANVNAYDRYHISPLMYAAREGRALVIQRLVTAGANINKQDNRGWTALTWAVSKNQPRAVRALLQANADMRKKHTDGQTVIDLAYVNNMDEMLEILEGKKRLEQDTSLSAATPAAHPAGQHTPETREASISSFESVGTKYGEMELFLCGLDLGRLIPVFHSQHVDFNTLLRMTEDDLIKVGISQLGVRKKILDGTHAVHKKDWEKSSLPTLNYNKQVSCAEALAVVANISKHTQYITMTIGYLGDQIRRNPAIVDELQDGTSSKQLTQHVTDTMKHVENLHKQLSSLQMQLNKDNSPSDPPDMIKKKSGSKHDRYKHLLIVLSGTAIGMLVWKRHSLLNKIFHLVSPAGD